MTHFELLELAHKNGLKVIAFTDHDTLPSHEIIAQLNEQYSNFPTQWVIGIEVSSALPRELGGLAFSGLHIVGLFIDPTNAALIEHCKRAQSDRLTRMERMVANLQTLGLTISPEDCLHQSGGETVGRPHIVRALLTHPENLAVIARIRQELKEAAEAPTASQETKDLYQAVQRKADEFSQCFLLFLGDKAFYPHVYVEHEYLVDLDQSVALIRNAGGIAVLAHYFTAEGKINHEFLEAIIRDHRIDALETVFGMREFATTHAQRAFCKQLVQKYPHLIESGGGDIHTPQDMEKFCSAETRSVVVQTHGFYEKMLASGRITNPAYAQR